ncbi:MAG: UDP-N-acetylglucosamine 1-carboxyvinyltransferase [Chloroflexi bacterium]|nr:UDP-N-acetylglucosamine 1-carboxyvinyltransferase [Chloroflexota bacterium]
MKETIAYRIRGGHPVRGEIKTLGAKNFATKAMVAALLSEQPTTLTNVPPIGDTDITQEMLESVGIKVTRRDDTMTIDPSAMKSSHVPTPHSGSNRIPILLLGALLHHWSEVFVPVLGGDKIGTRGVDFHLAAIRAFGGIIEETDDGFVARRYGKLHGAQINLPYPSVGATETSLYLGVLAEGRTVITNAAMEPEIFELITMLRSMGAIIFTTPNREIRIDGVPALSGTTMPILGDRLEAASWACLACASDGDITVHGIRPETLGNFLSYYQLVGGGIELKGAESIRFFRRGAIRPTMIETDVYPGFSTDWQQPFAILLTQADGISVIHETVYEKRFGYLKALNKLGAKTQLTTHCLGSVPCRYRDQGHEHSAIIMGPTPFHDADEITIPDLRAGLAYVIAAAIAPGETQVNGIAFLERGYGDIAPRLTAMNLGIEKVTVQEIAPVFASPR